MNLISIFKPSQVYAMQASLLTRSCSSLVFSVPLVLCCFGPDCPQTDLRGRVPDSTDVIVRYAALGWIGCCSML